MEKQSSFQLGFGIEGQSYQIVSINSSEKVTLALSDMGIVNGANLNLVKKSDNGEIVIFLNFAQITLTPKLHNAIRVVEVTGLKHNHCGNCGSGCGRHKS